MNNATFIGNLGKDAELKELEGGKKVINFSIAVPDGKDKTIWVDCAKWSEKTAVLPYLLKGTKVAVTGQVGIRKWEGGATLTLRVLDLELLGSKVADAVAAYVAPASQPATPETTADHSDLPF